MVLLITSDNEQIAVDRDIAERSAVIRATLEAIGEGEQPITLPKVKSNILKKVLEYCEHHRGEPLPTTDAGPQSGTYEFHEISEWDQKFIAVESETLYELVAAANNLDIEPLLDLTAETALNMVKGKGPEEARKVFGI